MSPGRPAGLAETVEQVVTIATTVAMSTHVALTRVYPDNVILL
ncbi:hypothetical protein [Gordonia hankookensis]|nr:hypothetical protein [Gordonia hankookensis]